MTEDRATDAITTHPEVSKDKVTCPRAITDMYYYHGVHTVCKQVSCDLPC